MKKHHYKIRYDNIAIIISMMLLITVILDFKYIMDLILYNPYNKGLTVVIKLMLEVILLLKTTFYIIEKKTL